VIKAFAMDRNLLSILVFGTIAVCVGVLVYILFKDSAKPSAVSGKDRRKAREARKVEAKDTALHTQKLQQAVQTKGPSKREAFNKVKEAKEKHEEQKEALQKRRREEDDLRLQRLEEQKNERRLEQKQARKTQKQRERQNQEDHARLLQLQEQLEREEDERVRLTHYFVCVCVCVCVCLCVCVCVCVCVCLCAFNALSSRLLGMEHSVIY
jgi:hypothetical protein